MTVFPTQGISLRITSAHSEEQEPSLALPQSMADHVWLKHDGKMAALGPCGHVGVELRILYDQVLDSIHPTPPGIAHAICGSRLRLFRSRTVSEGWRMATLEPLVDDVITEARLERLHDEVCAAAAPLTPVLHTCPSSERLLFLPARLRRSARPSSWSSAWLAAPSS